MSFLLDSDTSSAYLKGNRKVHGRVIQYGGQLHVSTVTMGELFAWALRARASPRRLLDLSDFLKDVTILDVDRAVARRYGEVQAALLDVGRPAPGMDLMIGATALVHGLTLVTHNSQDFANIPGLPLVDWLSQ